MGLIFNDEGKLIALVSEEVEIQPAPEKAFFDERGKLIAVVQSPKSTR